MEQLILRVEKANTRLEKLNQNKSNDVQQETTIIQVCKYNKYSFKQKAMLVVAVVIVLIFVIILLSYIMPLKNNSGKLQYKLQKNSYNKLLI